MPPFYINNNPSHARFARALPHVASLLTSPHLTQTFLPLVSNSSANPLSIGVTNYNSTDESPGLVRTISCTSDNATTCTTMIIGGSFTNVFGKKAGGLAKVRMDEERRLERSDSENITQPSYITNNLPLVASLLASSLNLPFSRFASLIAVFLRLPVHYLRPSSRPHLL